MPLTSEIFHTNDFLHSQQTYLPWSAAWQLQNVNSRSMFEQIVLPSTGPDILLGVWHDLIAERHHSPAQIAVLPQRPSVRQIALWPATCHVFQLTLYASIKVIRLKSISYRTCLFVLSDWIKHTLQIHLRCPSCLTMTLRNQSMAFKFHLFVLLRLLCIKVTSESSGEALSDFLSD